MDIAAQSAIYAKANAAQSALHLIHGTCQSHALEHIPQPVVAMEIVFLYLQPLLGPKLSRRPPATCVSTASMAMDEPVKQAIS